MRSATAEKLHKVQHLIGRRVSEHDEQIRGSRQAHSGASAAARHRQLLGHGGADRHTSRGLAARVVERGAD